MAAVADEAQVLRAERRSLRIYVFTLRHRIGPLRLTLVFSALVHAVPALQSPGG